MPDVLTRRVRGLPVGAWLAAAVVGVAIAVAINRRRKRSEPPAAEPGDESTPVGESTALPFTPGGFVVGGGGGVSATGQGVNPSGLPTASTNPATNDDWLNAGTRFLVGKGYSSVIAYDALSRYISGETLTPAMQALVDQASIAYGPPPTPVPAAPTPPTSTPPTSIPGGNNGGADDSAEGGAVVDAPPGVPYSPIDDPAFWQELTPAQVKELKAQGYAPPPGVAA